ncbi:MAG: UbiD family decarboxylase [Thermodesulfobacteriota bacterium]
MINIKDLRSYLSLLEKEPPGVFIKIRREVSSKHVLTAVVKKLADSGRDPVVLFENVAESSHQVLTNVFANRRAVALALDTTPENLLPEYLKRLDRPIPPEMTREAPVKEVVLRGNAADLTALPVPIHHKDDAGPYITCGTCITRNLDGKTVNLGMYRFMVAGPRDGGMFINPMHHGGELLRQAEKENRPLEMAVVIGGWPTLALASQNNEPIGTDDYALAGGLAGRPLRLVESETLAFPVPADAEIVIEGEIRPGERREEGPFGEYTGFYGMQRQSPVFRVRAISHRNDYIFHSVVPAGKEHVGLWVMPSKEANLYKKIKAVFPTVKEVRLPLNGVGYHAYVRIEKVRNGDGRNVLLALLGGEFMVKHAIVVDEDINIQNDDEVLWAVANLVQADQDIFVVPRARSSVLDPSSYGLDALFTGEGMVTKMGIDATRPVGVEFPKRVAVSAEAWDQVDLDELLG